MTEKPVKRSAPTFLGWTWQAHLNEVHKLVEEERWLEVAKRLSAMLAHALDKAVVKRRNSP